VLKGGSLACLVSAAEYGFARPPTCLPLRFRGDFDEVALTSTLGPEEMADLYLTEFEGLMVVVFGEVRFGVKLSLEVERGVLFLIKSF